MALEVAAEHPGALEGRIEAADGELPADRRGLPPACGRLVLAEELRARG